MIYINVVQKAGHFHDLAGHLVKSDTVPPKAGRLAGLGRTLTEDDKKEGRIPTGVQYSECESLKRKEQLTLSYFRT